MDKECADLLGPQEGKKYFKNNRLNSNTPVLNKHFSFKVPQPKVPVQPPSKHRSPAEEKNQFQHYHKKPNAKFLQDVNSKRPSRAAEMENRRKSSRAEMLMMKRNLNIKSIDMSEFDSSNNKSGSISAISTKSNLTKSINVTNSKSVIKPHDTNISNFYSESQLSDARKAKLLKWKEEKQKMSAPVKPPPFKPGGPAAVNGNLKTAMMNPPVATTGRCRPTPYSAPKIPQQSQESERRVTRAMAKTQSGPVQTAKFVPGAVSAKDIKPAINKMKNLNLATTANPMIPSHKNVKGVQAAKKPVQAATSIQKKKDTPNKTANEIVKKETEIMVPPQVVAEPAKVQIKKLKPKAIDPVFTEYNAAFSRACELLTSHAKYWRNLVDTTTDIPEDVRDDIISALGKVKLLLDSKLPQFGQLLYQYLCKEMDPVLILECDLQGWWDVATIQVDAVNKEFQRLKEMEQTNWVAPPKIIPVLTKRVVRSSLKNEEPKTPAKTAKATNGLKAFLAMKRKATNNSENNKIELKQNTPVKQQPMVLDNKFEYGFFDVNSPGHIGTPRSSLRLSGTSISVSAKKTPSTPSRRVSNNFGLRALSLRQSMGPMYKLGAGFQSNDDISS